MVIIRVLVAVMVFLHFGGAGLLPKAGYLPSSAHLITAANNVSQPMSIVAVICGGLVFVGLLVRPAAVPLLVLALLAVLSSKLPHLSARDILFFHSPDADRYGAWSIVHDVRADFVILFGCVFLIYEGAGRLSADWWITSRRRFRRRSTPTRSRLSRPD